MAPTTAAARSAPVEVMTRAVKVDALNPWSMVKMRYCSTARAWSARDLCPRASRGSSRRSERSGRGGSAPGRLASRWAAVSRVGTTAQSRSAWARSSSWSMSWVGRHPSSAPSNETAVRRTSSGGPIGRGTGSTAATPVGELAQAGHLGGEAPPAGPVGQLAVEEQVPDVLERASCGQLGRVLAVVVEALEAPDVADRSRRPPRLRGRGHVGDRSRRRAGSGPRPAGRGSTRSRPARRRRRPGCGGSGDG